MSVRAGVLVDGGFDDIRSRDVRFLEEASGLGEVTVRLWPDEAPAWRSAPKFCFAERSYILNAIRFVGRVAVVGKAAEDTLRIWAERETQASVARESMARDLGLEYRVISEARLDGFPQHPPVPRSGAIKVAVTGCYDWLHSGHVRFFEEAASFGALTVFVGNDAALAGLKGPGHPRFPQDERRYLVAAVAHVHRAQVSTGSGWLDAEAQIRASRPDIWIVNEDGDKPCKRDLCRELGIDYRVLTRRPADGLPARSSTELRGDAASRQVTSD